MATVRLRRHAVAVYMRNHDVVNPAGAHEIARAVAGRNLEALSAALAEHPDAWQTDLIQLDPDGRATSMNGPVPHYVIMANWHSALPVLHAAGAPLGLRHPESNLTLLQQAATHARPSALRYLLSQREAHDLDAALACVVGSSNKSSRSLLRSARELVKSGANPWSASITGSGSTVLPVIAMRHQHMDLACWMLENFPSPSKKGLECPDWGEPLRAAWFDRMKNGYYRLPAHLQVARALLAQGQAGAIGEWLPRLDGTDRSRSVVAGCPSPYQAVVATMEVFLDGEGFAPEDVAAHWSALSKHAPLARALSCHQDQLLETTTPIPTRHRPPRRL